MFCFVLIGLRSGDGKSNSTVRFHHRQFRNLTHSGVTLLHADQKVHIGLFDAMSDKIITFKATVSNNQCLLLECVPFHHFYQRADFVFLRLWLNDNIRKGTAE